MSKKFIIITPDSYFGSFGDQAMLVSTASNLLQQDNTAEIIFFNVYDAPIDNLFADKYGLNVQIYYPKTNVFTEFMDIVKDCDEVYVIGADIIDGAYSENAAMMRYKLIDIAHAFGVKTSILGFSFGKTPTKKICKTIKYISNYTILNVRDIDSLTRLQKIGCKNTRLVADTAFLFDETHYPKSKSADELYVNLSKINKTIIGVNITHKRQTDCKPFIKKVCDALQQLDNIYVVIFPHDVRTYDDVSYFDKELCQILGDELLSRGIECINAFNYLENETDVKHILNLVDFVITCRMHLAIAALSKGIPPISFVYNDKFEGLYKLYKLNTCLMLQRACDKNEIINSINYVMNQDIKSVIREKNTDIFQMSKKNFDLSKFSEPFLQMRKNHIKNYVRVEPQIGPYYNFVSLGWDCFSRTVLTWWNMKHTKAEGEPSMPFDLAMHNIRSTIQILDNDFADFFETIRFDEQTGNWYNDKYYNVYNHDQNCTTTGEFKERYLNRINNFRQVVQSADHVFFVYHDSVGNDTKKRHIKKLAKILLKLRGNKKFRLIVVSAKHRYFDIKNTSFVYVKEPYIDYVWLDDEHKSMLANEYEVKVVNKISRICKKYTFVWNLLTKLRQLFLLNKQS